MVPMVMVVASHTLGPAHPHRIGRDGGDDGVRNVVYVRGVVHHLDVRHVGGAVGRGRGQVLLAGIGRAETVPAVASWVGSEEDGGRRADGLAQGLGVSFRHGDRLSGVLHLSRLVRHLCGAWDTVGYHGIWQGVSLGNIGYHGISLGTMEYRWLSWGIMPYK